MRLKIKTIYFDLGAPYNEQYIKKECFNPNVDTCGACKCNSSGEGN